MLAIKILSFVFLKFYGGTVVGVYASFYLAF